MFMLGSEHASSEVLTKLEFSAFDGPRFNAGVLVPLPNEAHLIKAGWRPSRSRPDDSNAPLVVPRRPL